MPLRIVQNGDIGIPTIVCDHCGEAITDVDDGNYHWRFDDRGDYPGAPVYFTHKRCCFAFEKSNPAFWGALTLNYLFAFLTKGLNLNLEHIQARADYMHEPLE